MTTDDYTTAAREEARRAWWDDHYRDMNQHPPFDFAQHMAEWARVYLTQQKPSDAEVEAAARAMRIETLGDTVRPGAAARWWDSGEVSPDEAEKLRRLARAALRAARDVRGQA